MKYTVKTFSAMADPLRLRCLALLTENKELCICEFVFTMKEPQPKISRHMMTLRDAGLVKSRKDAQWLHYRLAKDLPDWQLNALRSACDAMKQEGQHKRDVKRLGTMTNRPSRS